MSLSVERRDGYVSNRPEAATIPAGYQRVPPANFLR
jgi:hypothetical protein